MATNQGLLQAQIKVKNTIDLNNAFSSPSIANPQLKSIEGELNLSNEYALQSFNSSNTNTQHIDTIRTNSNNTSLKEALNNLPNLQYVRLEGNYESKGNSFDNNTNLQKVDLSESLQVKPEDFKANESLRELPKLDYSNPDLTDIITNDTNLKPTTFDISNKPNTNKLGIHGDSTHQLGNLEFVKVNSEAPFDNQITPQINTSYTSLDRNGLVNLFNTMPYNVGYQVVGNPIIVDGVVSGFSSSDYIRVFASANTLKDNFQIDLKINYPGALPPSRADIFSIGSKVLIYYTSNGVIQAYIHDSDNNIRYLTFNSSSETDSFLRMQYTSTGVKTYTSTDGETYTLKSNYQGTPLSISGAEYVSFGKGTFAGSIDLNQTYIKVNGKLWFGHESKQVTWFKGKPSQIKVLDISGATGTSSLTNDDKAIVTNKGWRLVTDGSNSKNYTIEDGKLTWANSGLYLTGPVNYTIVGSPTIADGVASGFSGSNYLKLPYFGSTIITDFEMNVECTLSSTTSGRQQQTLFGSYNSNYSIDEYRVIIYDNGGATGTVTVRLLDYTDPDNLTLQYTTILSNVPWGTYLKINLSCVNSQATVIVKDENDTVLANVAISHPVVLLPMSSGENPSIGAYRSSYAWDGSINLNKTYIKVNGSLWFYGKNYASNNIAPVPAGFTFGNITTSSIGYVDMRTQQFTAAPEGATYGWDL